MLNRTLARQLGHPSGILGRLVLGPLWNRRNAALNDLAFDRLSVEPDDRVLDVGFGGGYLLRRIAAATSRGLAAGADASPAMVAFASRRLRPALDEGRVELVRAAAEALPFPDGHFTKACSVNSLFYWREPRAAFSEIARVLRAGGAFVLVFTDRASLAGKAFAREGLSLYDADDARPLLEGAGFRVLGVEDARDRHRRFWCLVAARREPR